MRVLCRSGHLAFYPRTSTEISRFCSYFKQELVRVEDYYTFPNLADAEDYSLVGKPYLNLPAIKTFEGNPWDVLSENKFVYNLATGLIVPAASITFLIQMPQVGFFFLPSVQLIQPGSIDTSGQQILSYSAEYVQDTFQLKVSEFDYE